MTTEKHQPYGTDKLVEAYDRMMERARATVGATVQARLDKAMDAAVELGELTREEAEKVAAYLRRDLQNTARGLAASGKELRQWLRFDLQQIEDRVLETFGKMVDFSRIELAKLSGNLDLPTECHTGEVAGIGTLSCAKCGKELHFSKTGRIPPCPKCHHTVFTHRVSD